MGLVDGSPSVLHSTPLSLSFSSLTPSPVSPSPFLSQIGCALFGIAFLINLYRLLAGCCACCRGSRDGRRDVESGSAVAPRRRAAHAPTAAPYDAARPPPGYPKAGRQQRPPAQFIAA